MHVFFGALKICMFVVGGIFRDYVYRLIHVHAIGDRIAIYMYMVGQIS